MKTSRPKILSSPLLALNVAAALVALGTQRANAVDINKADNTDPLNVTTSWTEGVVPTSTDRAVYGLTTARSNALGADLSWQGIQMNANSAAWTITGANTLTLGSDGIDFAAGTGSLTISANVIQSADATYNMASGRNLSLNGTLTGSGNITTAVSTGLISFGGDTSGYTGQLTVATNTVISVNTNTGLGTQTVIMSNGKVNAGTSDRTVANNFSISNTVGVEAVNSTRDLTLTGVISGAGGITKSGTGTVRLTRDNTYLGTTTVGAGTLLVDGDASAATGAVAVNAGGTLGGNGTIGGATTIANAATAILAPGGTTAGPSAGALTFSNALTLAGADSKVNFDIATGVRGVAYDAVNVGGLLTYNGDFTLTAAAPIDNGIYDLFSLTGGQTGDFDTVAFAGGVYTAAFTRSGDVWTAAEGGQTFSFDETTGDLTVVPEPSTGMMLISAMGFSLLLRRRSRTA
jgi:fibronectin-binding autotransporter adhesin